MDKIELDKFRSFCKEMIEAPLDIGRCIKVSYMTFLINKEDINSTDLIYISCEKCYHVHRVPLEVKPTCPCVFYRSEISKETDTPYFSVKDEDIRLRIKAALYSYKLLDELDRISAERRRKAMEKIKEKLEEIERISRPSGIDSPFIHKQAESVLSLIEEMKKTGIWVEIPDITEHGNCNPNCPLLKQADFFRAECYNNLMPNHDEKPGPSCPRYKEEGNERS